MKIFLSALFTILFSQIYTAQNLEKEIAILGDHYRLNVPVDANISNRGPSDIMSANPSEEAETRIVIDSGQERFVIFCRELCSIVGGELKEEVKKYFGKYIEAFGEVTINDLVKSNDFNRITVSPQKIDSTKNAILLYDVFLEHKDNSIQEIGFYINPAAFSRIEHYRLVSKKIIESISTGKSILNFNEQEYVLKLWDAEYTILIPENYMFRQQNGPDFKVFTFTEMVSLNDVGSSLGIYFGGYPDFQFSQAGYEGDIQNESVEILQNSTKWNNWQSGKNLTSELIIKIDEDNELSMHIFITTKNKSELKVLQNFVKSIKIK